MRNAASNTARSAAPDVAWNAASDAASNVVPAIACPLRVFVLLLALALGGAAGPVRAASLCGPSAGAPGPQIGLADAGFGSIGPGIGALPGQTPSDLVSNLVGASVPREAACGASGSGDSRSPSLPGAAEPATLPAPLPGRAAGNPVDLVTGNKYHRAVDVVLPDPESGLKPALREALGADAERVLGEAWQAFEPLRFVFTRHYNSRFDAAGVLGPGWRHGFETALARLRGPAGIELQVVQADGRRLVFRPGKRRDSGFEGLAPASGSIREHPDAGLPWAWHWPDGRVLRFDPNGALARVEAPDGERLALEHDARARLLAIRDASGRALRFEHAGGRLVALVLPDGLRIRYDYDVHGVLSAVRYPDGRTLRLHYEDLQAFHLLTGIELPDGRRSRYRYDEFRRVVESHPIDGRKAGVLSFAWRPPDRVGGVGRTVVTEGGRISTWRWRVDRELGQGSLLSVEGEPCSSCPVLDPPRNREIERSPRVRLALDYDRFGLPAEARISGRARRSDAPDSELSMHLRWKRHPSGPLAGKLAWVERLSPDGRAARTILRHDQARRLIAVEGPEGLVERIERDALGRALVRIGPDRARRAARFDDHWRLREWRVREALTAIRWNHEGLPSEIAWPSGDRWTFEWRAGEVAIRSARGWIARSADRFSQDASHGLASGAAAVALAGGVPDPFVLDAAGRRTDYRYDDFGRLVEEQTSDAGWRRYRHDPWGRVERVESAGGLVEHRRHDLAGRLLEREQSGGGEQALTRFAWQGGLLTGITHPLQQTGIEHDLAGRVTAITDEIDGVSHRWSFVRDAGERVVSRGLPGGVRIDYAYDRQGRPVSMRLVLDGKSAGVPIVDDTRYRNGRAVAWRYGNGARFERRDDAAGRPLEWAWHGDRGLPVWRYRWRVDGLPAAIAEAGQERRLGWDVLGRLIVDERHRTDAPGAGAARPITALPVTGEPSREYFAWDLAGELRFARDRRGWTRSAGENSPPRDADGRVMRHRELTLRRGAQGRVVEVLDGDRAIARYAYNAAGERIVRRVGAGRAGFLYRERALAAETGADGRVHRHYLRWMGMPVAIVDLRPGGPVVSWLHGDHLGTPHAATDSAGRLIWQAEYQAFGSLSAESGSLRQPLRFAGQHHDPETGLHDNYLRSYDPDAARFLEPDPLGLAGGLNRFAYADGNPVMGSDPLGLILFAFDGTYNAATPPGQDDQSNVWKFFQLYADEAKWYMTGVGLDDPGSGIRTNLLDPLDANTARTRVDYMLGELDVYMNDTRIGEPIMIDVVGFSRGAAMARDFTNRVALLDAERQWWARGLCIDMRFLGLWDTVAQFGLDGGENHRWELGIPASVGATYHAVALNEHRPLFPLEGASGPAVIERGFIGSHSDVGGGNAEGDLSDISLVWMVRMAVRSGLPMSALPEKWLRVDAPILHDRSAGIPADRQVSVRDSSGRIVSRTSQRVAPIAGMSWAASRAFLITPPRRGQDAYGRYTIVGSVDMDAYSKWLAEHYDLKLAIQ